MNRDRINVFWDIENCAVPNGVAPHQIAEHLRNALASVDLHGPISLSAFGDVQKHSKSVQQALADTNIYFKNVPNGEPEGVLVDGTRYEHGCMVWICKPINYVEKQTDCYVER